MLQIADYTIRATGATSIMESLFEHGARCTVFAVHRLTGNSSRARYEMFISVLPFAGRKKKEKFSRRSFRLSEVVGLSRSAGVHQFRELLH